MLHKIAAFILMVAFSIHTFQKIGTIMNYYVNKAAYEKQCENKLKPLLQCHGKCLLMKKIIAEQKKEQKNPELKLDNKSETFDSPVSLQFIRPLDANVQVMSLSGSNNKLLTRSFPIFHPPPHLA